MAATFRSGLAANLGSGTSTNISLPAGAQSGDWVLVTLVLYGVRTISWGSGLVELYQAIFDNAYTAIATKQLTATDVTNAVLSFTQSASGTIAGGIVAYYNCGGFGTPGSVVNRTGLSNSITAQAVPLTSGQSAVVIRAEASTSNPGPATVTPATTGRASYYSNGTSSPSIWLGDYTTASANRVFTDPVTSSNAFGMQVPILDSGVIPGGGIFSNASMVSNGVSTTRTQTVWPHPLTTTGDLLLLVCSISNDATGAVALSGWSTLVGDAAVGNGRLMVLSHVNDPGDGPTYTATITGSSSVKYTLVSVRGWDTNRALLKGALGTRAASGGTNLTTLPSVTVGTNWRMLACVYERTSATDNTPTIDNSFTILNEAHTMSGDSNQSVTVAYKTQVTAGAVGDTTVTFTNTNATYSAGLLIGIPFVDSGPLPVATLSVWDGTSEITGVSLSVWDGTTEVTGVTIDSIFGS